MSILPGGEVDTVERFLFDVLANDATLQTLGLQGVYDFVAPDEAAYPFAVYQPMVPMSVRGVGTIHIMTNDLWRVRFTDSGAGLGRIAPLAKRAYDLLQNRQGVYVDGGGLILSCIYYAPYHAQEITGGGEFRHLGGLYRFEVQ